MSTELYVLIGVIIATPVVKLIYSKYLDANRNNVTKSQNTEVEKTLQKTVQNKIWEVITKLISSSIFWYCVGVILLCILLYMLWVYFSPDISSIVVGKKYSLMPYLIAPVMGLMSYFLSNRGYKRFSYSLMITAATAVVITLWIHPEVLKAVISPFGEPLFLEQAKDFSGEMFAGCFALTLIILAILSGKLIEVIVGIVLMIILWNIIPWNCF